MRWRRWLAGAGLVGIGLVGVALAGATGFAVFLGTDRGNAWLEHRIEEAVTLSMAEGRFEIDGLKTDLLYNARLDGLRIVDDTGAALVSVGPVHARYNVGSLVNGALVVHRLEGVDLAVVLDAGPSGRMRLAELFGPPSESTDPFELPIDFDVRDLSIEGARIRQGGSLDLRGAVVKGAVVSDGPRFDVSELELCAHVLRPGPTTACVDGPVLWDGALAELDGLSVAAPGTRLVASGTAGGERLGLQVSVDALDLTALDPVASNAGLAGTWAGKLAIIGPPEALSIAGGLAGTGESRGSLTIAGRAGVGEAITWGGAITAAGFHVEDVYPLAGRPVILDGVVGLDGTGVSFPNDLVLDLTYAGKADIEGTYILEDTDAVGRIEQGVLTLDKGAFTGIAGRLDATGTLHLTEGPLDIRVRGTIDPAEIAELGIEGLGGTGTADLRLSGNIREDATRYGVRGTVVMAPFSYTADIAFERVTADLSGQVVGADFTFDVDATAVNGVAYGLQMGEVGAPAVHVTSRSRDIQAVGPASVTAIRYPGVGTFEDAQVSFDYRLPAAAPMAVDADVTLGAFDIQTFPGSGGHATVAMLGTAVKYDASLDAWGRELAASRGEYDLGTGHLEAGFVRVAPTPRLAWASKGAVALTVVEGGVHDARVAMTGLHGEFDIRGDLATTGPVDGTLAVQGFQLDVLAELFPDLFPGVSGLLDLDATLEGDAAAPSIRGRTDVKGFWMEDVARWLDVAGPFTVEHGRADVRLDIGSAGEPLAVVTGRIPVVADLSAPGLDPTGRVDAQITLKPGDFARLENITPTELGLPEGRVSAQVRAAGLLGDPDLRIHGVAETALGGWDLPARAEFDIRREGSDIDAWAELREGLSERIRVSGGGTTRMSRVFDAVFAGQDLPDTSDLELWLDNMAVSAVLNGLPADSIVRAGEVGVSAGGELVGGFTASGSPYVPTFEGGVHWFRPRLGNEVLESAYFTVTPADAGIVIDAALAFQGGQLALSGPVPIRVDLREESSTWAQGELDLALSGEDIPLGLLSVVDAGIVDASGKASVDGVVRGTFADPIPDLDASISGGALTYLPVGLRLRDIDAKIEAGQRRVKLTRFAARTSPLNQVGLVEERKGSQINVTGATNLAQGFPEELSAQITLDQAWVMGTYEAAIRLDGQMLVSGKWPHLNVITRKPIELVTGRVVYNSAAAEVAGPLQPSERIVIHRGGQQRRTERIVELPFYAGFDVDADVDLNRNLEVIAAVPFFDELGSVTANLTRANASSRLGGLLAIALDEAGNPLLQGEVEVVDGSVQVLQTKFGLDEGRLVFLGGDVGETQVDVRGSTSIDSIPVSLVVSGTVDAPKLVTSAEGLDDTQILVMLLTGRAPDTLSGDASRAANDELRLAAALVASTVLSGAATGALTIEPDGAIRIGAPWSTSVLTELVLRPLAGQSDNAIAFSLEWAIARRLLLEVGAGNVFQWTQMVWETRF